MRRLLTSMWTSGRASAALCLMVAVPAVLLGEDAKKDPDAIGDRTVACKVNWFSMEKEIAIGKQMAEQVEKQSKIITDPVIAEYVNRIGQNLVRNSDAKVPFTIKVIDAEEVNAFALPGGYFFVYSGLVLKADTEAELAGVMAHEIAHVAARHGTCQATKGQMVNLASIPLIFLGGWAGYGIRQGMSLLVPMGFLQFSREYEKQADYLGLQYLYKTGYDPVAFVDFFEKIETMQKRKTGAVAKMFSTHPMTGDRIAASQKEIATILKAKPEYVVTTSEFNDVKARVASLHNTQRLASKDADPNRPTLRRNPNAATSIGDETDPAKQSAGDSEDRPTLKRRPADDSSTPAPDSSNPANN
jgi:beta-barrel assembly-enhancing protease